MINLITQHKNILAMKKEVKELWVEALRSGKYVQGESMLNDGERYCCLGVLCEVYKEQTGIGEWKKSENLSGISCLRFVGDYSSEWAELPIEVLEWAEFSVKDSNPTLRFIDDSDEDNSYTEEENLASLNDYGGYNFNDIAYLIENFIDSI